MSQIDKIRIRIQAAVIAGRVSKYALAKRAHIPATTLIGMEGKGWNPNSKTLAALELALHELIRERRARPKLRRGAYQPAA